MVGSAERKVKPVIPSVVIPPGGTLGVMGGGQLGAMFAMAAKRMGYRVEAFSDVADCPAAHHCDRVHVGAYDDPAALLAMARGIDVLTFEFENVLAAPLEALVGLVPVRPAPAVLFTTQDRGREKAFLVREGFACAPHRLVRSRDELHAAVSALGLPAVLKTAAFGYDGKGQRKLDADAIPRHIDAAWDALAVHAECVLVLEGWVDFECEISVVAARGLDGSTAVFAPTRNHHSHHILDISSTPAGLPDAVLDTAREMAAAVLQKLDVVGVACVEFFVTKDGRVLVNEIAPRPHNSGHLTIQACETSRGGSSACKPPGAAAPSPRSNAAAEPAIHCTRRRSTLAGTPAT
ncbi:MAG: 5-(carboxyamino)imidazole ribonucleotide synthase, partial [Planctomycetia bacterium]